jgi:hypothetical protein
MRIRWKTGFNRLFVVAALGWAIYALWYVPVQQWHEQFDLASDKWSLCLSAAAHAQSKAPMEQCNSEHEKDFRAIPHTAWTGFDQKSWAWLIGLATVPPLVAYWLLRGVGLIASWVWRGFRKEPR